MPVSTFNPANQELTISAMILMLRRRRKLIIYSVAGCFLLAVLVCIFMTRRYEATGEIQVARQSSDELGLDGMRGDSNLADDPLADNIALETKSHILESDTLALRVIENLGLENTKDFQPKFNPVTWLLGLVSPDGPKDPANASLEDSPVRRTRVLKVFSKHLKIKAQGGTQLIDISFLSSDPQTAAAVVNAMMKGLLDYTFETRFKATNEGSHWLAGQMSDLKKQAETLQSKVSQLQKDAGVYSLGTVDSAGKDMAYSATLDRLQQTTEALNQAISNRIVKGSIYEMAKSGDPEVISGLAGTSLTGVSQAVSNSFDLLQSLRSQQASLESQLAAATSKYGSANPKLDDVKASLASTDGAITREVKRIGQRAQNDYRAARLTEANLRKSYQEERAAADQLNNKAVEYSIAKQEADQSRSLYEKLYQHLKEAGVMEGLRASNVTVVDPGRAPAKPARPNVPLYLAASIFAGLFFGSLAALFFECIDNRVQNIESIESSLNTPMLGVIPIADGNRRKWSELQKSKITRRLTDGLSAPAGPSVPVSPDASNAAFAEAISSLRTSLLLSRSAAPPKVVLVTSAAEGEGKSTIALNLAAAMVRNGSSALLVEADMRRPVLESRFSVPGRKGLSNLLAGDLERLEVSPFRSLPDLGVIPAGPPPPYPAELLGSMRMRELVAAWSRAYDFVIIDSPALLAVTDAAVLSRIADITLLVTRHSQSTRKSLERAWQILHHDPETKVGVVLNGLMRDSAEFGEYFGYYGDSYYLKAEARTHA